MISRILFVAAFLLVGMIAVKDGRFLRVAGLVGSCRVYQQAVDGTQWEACRAGRLEGRPDLSARGCSAGGVAGRLEYWHCPAGIAASAIGR
jgi:hypothetical protein